MKQIAFTIVAKNYIGLAQVLEKSFVATTDADFYIIVADEINQNEITGLPSNVLMAKNCLEIDRKLWYEMAFKYNLVEFCTAIKPFCFQYFFEKKNAGKIIFLDPDVFIFHSLNKVFDKLNDCSVMLTPHIVTMQTRHSGALPDYLFLINGIFNLGFLALKKSGKADRILQWWAGRLIHQCFFDNERGMATDQKWVNLLPAFLTSEQLCINRSLGLNLAPWNFFERKIIVRNNVFFVTSRINNDEENDILYFVHFSGFNYKNFSESTALLKKGANYYPDIEPAFEKYAAALASSSFNRFINLSYTYNFFDNNKIIISLHRRIYRRLIDENKAAYNNPFSTGNDSFFALLKKHKLIDNATASGDAVSNKNIPAFNSKLKLVNAFFIIIQRIAGIRRYSMISRFFKRYFREENQVFLADKSEQGFY